MEIYLSIFFYALSWILFILGLFEERSMPSSEDEQTKSDHLVIIFLFFTFMFMVIAGIVMLYAGGTYYSSVSDSLETHLFSEYRPIGYAMAVIGFIPLIMMITKIFDCLGAKENNGD